MKAVLFDLDGTLADTLADLAASVNHALGRLGRPPRLAEEVRGFIGDGVSELMRLSLGAGADPVLDEAVALFREHYSAHCVDKTTLYPGVARTLDALSVLPLAVVTNKPEAPSRRILEVLGVAGRFHALIGGDSWPERKPLPGPLLEAARRIGADPAEALMVGDSPGDVEAGRRAGARTCAVTFGYRSRTELAGARPDFIVDQMTDVLSLMEVKRP